MQSIVRRGATLAPMSTGTASSPGRDRRALRSRSRQFLLRIVPLVRSGAEGSGPARVPDAGMPEAARVRRVREDAESRCRAARRALLSRSTDAPPAWEIHLHY